MKTKFTLALLGLVLIATMGRAYDGQKIATRVDKVIMFLTGAQVTRSATVTVNPGVSTLTFENISPDIDVQSIQVHAEGAFTILSVKTELNFLNTLAKQKQLTDLQAQQKLVKDKVELQNSLLVIYREEEDMLGKNKVVTGQNANLDILKLKEALNFQTQRLIDLKKKEQVVVNGVAALNEELQKYDKQIAEITKGEVKNTSDIIVTISSKVTTQAPFTLSYLVHNAGWYPTYDIRAKNVNSPLNIAYKANVSQKCGEDWKSVKLVLSTGNPSVSGSKPELKPYYLTFGMVYANQADNVNRVTGRIVALDDGQALLGVTVKVKGTSIGAASDANGNFSIQIPEGPQTLVFTYIGYMMLERKVSSSTMNVSLQPSKTSLNEVVVVGYGTSNRNSNDDDGYLKNVNAKKFSAPTTIPVEVEQTVNQTNVEFNIDNPYSIPSDGKQYGVEIANYDLDATYQYFVAPKLNTDVFLTAQLIDWNKYNFLSGEANLFFEGTYIGKSLLNTQSSNDTLNLSLGTDKNIIVTRTLQKTLTQRQVIGSNKKETKDWIIEVKNRKGQPVNLLVEDQLPVSQNTAIEVEKQELSAGKLNETDGKVQWVLKLAPAESKKLELRYQVKYPKNQLVIVQ